MIICNIHDFLFVSLCNSKLLYEMFQSLTAIRNQIYNKIHYKTIMIIITISDKYNFTHIERSRL